MSCCGASGFVTSADGSGAGGGGGGGLAGQAFTYTVTGAEPSLSDFMITLPTPQATDTYKVVGSLSDAVVIVGLKFPNAAAGDRTLTEFRLVATANLTAGDTIDFMIVEP